MLSKKELIKRLRNDPMYRAALKMASSDADRRRIIATTEGFLSSFMDSLAPMATKVSQDPAYADKLREALRTPGRLISESDGNVIDESKDKG